MPDDSKSADPSNATSNPPLTFYDLMALVINTTGTPDEKSKLIKELRSANPASEKALFLTVVGVLGAVAIGSVIAMCLPATKASDFLPIITGCIGALSGMLVSRGKSSGSPPTPLAPAGAGIADSHK